MLEYIMFSTFLLAASVPHITARRPLMIASLIHTAILGSALYFAGASVGALIYCVAISSSFVQIIIPNSSDPRIQQLRLVIASLAVVIGSTLLYSSPIDLIVVAGFVIYRFCETRTKTWEIKIGYFAGTTTYMMYSILSGVWFVATSQAIFLASCLIVFALQYFAKTDILTVIKNLKTTRIPANI